MRSPGQSPSRSATLSAGITLRPAVDPAPIGLVCRRPMAAGQVHAQIVPSGGTGASCWSRRAICAVHRARNAYDAGSHQRSAGSPPARQPVDALRGPLPHPGARTGGSRLWFPSLRLAFQKGHLTAQTWWAQVGSNYRLLACKAEYGQEYAQLTGPVHSLDLRIQCWRCPQVLGRVCTVVPASGSRSSLLVTRFRSELGPGGPAARTDLLRNRSLTQPLRAARRTCRSCVPVD